MPHDEYCVHKAIAVEVQLIIHQFVVMMVPALLQEKLDQKAKAIAVEVLPMRWLIVPLVRMLEGLWE